MTQTPRERARQHTMAQILTIGRRHLAEHGAAALSLRAVARDLGVVSSAVYRYIRSRDELLTLLVVDGYTAMGDAADAAVATAAADDFAAKFRALARAVREWALAESARYGLLFGSPVPGYAAPAEQTTAPGTRVVIQLVTILEGAWRQGMLRVPNSTVVSPELAADIASIREEMELTVPDAVVARGVLVWAALFGAVNFEVFGQYGAATFSDPAALFELHIAALQDMAGL